MPPLDDFPTARKRVQEFDRQHRLGVGRFWDDTDGVVFKNEKECVEKAGSGEVRQPDLRIRRLTSTVTCLESLMEAPDDDEDPDARFAPNWARSRLSEFIGRSLTSTQGWQSDEAAWVYCRVRTLGGAVRLIDGGIKAFDENQQLIAQTLLRQAWNSHDTKGGSFGLQEFSKEPPTDPSQRVPASAEEQYPANAFLTYWGLLAADSLRPLADHADLHVKPEERAAATDWLRANLGYQVTLHYAGSPQSDPQQLAWSICGLVRFGDAEVFGNSVSSDRQLLNAGLQAFFKQQAKKTWSRGAPLFHFRNAGNAYTYAFETMAELLSLATTTVIEQSTAEVLSTALREHSQELMLALEHAEETHQRLGNGTWGWNSGHHPHRDSPESWATASVYRYGQALRRLVGTWSCAAAKSYLGARRPSGDLKKLGDRGRTWNLGNGTAGQILTTAFVHPIERAQKIHEKESRFRRDPDQKVLGELQARSAMLFGPPGTCKTTLAESLAAAVGWDFIEVTPAQFLDQGVDHVSARADAIFRNIMELDHCVILFDEIDELIRKRSDEPESIERFFTTTMLPRLAKMWESRRILFFVNTNNVTKVDTAIARSQRFDALIFVLPPSYEKKFEMLKEKGIELAVKEEAITKALLTPGSVADDTKQIGWFAVIRHDQMEALMPRLSGGEPVDAPRLIEAMKQVISELTQLDWKDSMTAASNGSRMPNVAELHNYERRDSRALPYAQVSTEHAGALDVQIDSDAGVGWKLIDATAIDPAEWARDNGHVLTAKGTLEPVGDP